MNHPPHNLLPSPTELRKRIGEAMMADRRRLDRWLTVLMRERGNPPQMARLVDDVNRSVAQCAHRRRQVPDITYPPQLPVVEKREDIAALIQKHQVLVLCGETGSGKTTQLPKICLELGRGVAGYIGHTQPRRLAARSVAARIASELKAPNAVGYKVRFADTILPGTHIKLMTDGILLAETQRDRLLEQYDTLIIDEAHERSLNIDFLLGYLSQLLPQRPDLKLIVTSATIDPQRFSKHFNNAPIIEVSGRTFPVETRYRPITPMEDEDEEDPNVAQAILAAVDELCKEEKGDILIFLSGEREIRETAEELSRHSIHGGVEILPLYARLSNEEQNRIFATHPKRRIVLATNVAETSLTVPGIRYVIDPGFARISRYSHRSKVQRLPIEHVSRASADQRKGRCGRVAPGICIRLYSEEDYLGRSQFTEPEIQRTNLASVILQMKALNLGDPESFPFIEPPDVRLVRDGYQTLFELGAIKPNAPAGKFDTSLGGTAKLTPIGENLSRLPLDPRIGRMILAGANENCLPEMLVIASALSIQDPRDRPMAVQQAADEAHGKFKDPTSDFMSYIKLWEWFHQRQKELKGNALRKACQASFVSYVRMREWIDTHAQLMELAQEMGLAGVPPQEGAAARGPRRAVSHRAIAYATANPEAIHLALLTGLLGNIGLRAEGYEYMGPRGRRFHFHPSSALFKSKPEWIMAAEMVETTRLYARVCGPIRPTWIEKLAPHLIERIYSELRWHKDHAHVEADERISLHGLVLIPKRTIHYGPIDPKASREIFIRYALVEGDYRSRAPFLMHNKALIEEIRRMEAKLRRHDLLVESQVQYEFYSSRIPENINSGPRFERWRHDAELADPQLLFMQKEALIRHGAPQLVPSDYPDELHIGDSTLPLSYVFSPGEADDGITLTVPLALMPQLSPQRFTWLVPGLLLDKITALIKSLPSATRRNFVPVPTFAKAVFDALLADNAFAQAASLSLTEAITSELDKLTGIVISPMEWRPDNLPEQLHLRFRILNDAGVEVATGRDLIDLQNRVAPRASGAFTRIEHREYTLDALDDFPAKPLPERVEVHRHNMVIFGYPALLEVAPPPPPPGSHKATPPPTVSLRLLDTPETATAATRYGLIRLYLTQLHTEFHHLAHTFFPDLNEVAVHYSLIGTASELKNDLLRGIADRAFLVPTADIRSRELFLERKAAGIPRLPAIAKEMASLLRRTLEAYHTITLELERPYPADWTAAIFDINEQLRNLMPRHFIADTPHEWLSHFPRYLAAIQTRLNKLAAGHVSRDDRHMREVEMMWRSYLHRQEKHRSHKIHDPELVRYRWMIEELRVSVFAQELSTSIPISVKRLEKQLALVRS